jgi:hypothetical protein
VAVGLLAIEFVGILAPLVLLSGRLFSGPHDAPTLEGQYVLKDFILVAAGMVIAAGSFRGGRLVRDEPTSHPRDSEPAGDHRPLPDLPGHENGVGPTVRRRGRRGRPTAG